MLRAQFVKLGLFVGNTDAREVHVDEVIRAAAAVTVANLDEMRDVIKLDMEQFVQKTAPTLISISAYLFLTRGHHWKPEFEGLVNRT